MIHIRRIIIELKVVEYQANVVDFFHTLSSFLADELNSNIMRYVAAKLQRQWWNLYSQHTHLQSILDISQDPCEKS